MVRKKKSQAKKKSVNKKPAQTSLQKNKLVTGIIIGIVIGILLSLIFLKSSGSVIEKEVKTSCDIELSTLFEKSCTEHEDCYGRLELCSVSLKKCVTTVQVDTTHPNNVRVPDTREECESNGGTWTIELV